MATARTAWGIDVGNRALKAVKLVRDAEGIRIADFEVVEHEHVLSNAGDNRDSLIRGAISNFVQAHVTKGTSVAVGVSGQSSFARFIKLPPVEKKKIPQIVVFEAQQQIPFQLDDVEWAYQLFEDQNSPDIEVGIFAMRKELVQEHISFFTAAGLNVEIVQMNPLAVYNAMYHDKRLEGTIMIIDMGAENTDLIIAEGETVWLRSVPIGGNAFTEALVKSFKLRFEKAEELKRNAATSKYGRQILQAMRPIFSDLVAEIQRSIGFYASVHRDSRISKVLALGGTFRLPGLQKYLQQNLSLDVQKIDRLSNTLPTESRVATALNENILSSVSAYGLALQAMGEGKITTSLLPQVIRREREWKAKTKWFAAAAACIVAGTLVPVGRYYIEQTQYLGSVSEHAKADYRTTMDEATPLNTQWQGLENAGDTETKKIADIQAMVRYRSLWQNIYGDIIASNKLQPVGDINARSTLPRSSRKQIIVDEISPWYVNDLGPYLALDNSGILQYVGQTSDSPAGGRGVAGRGGAVGPAVGNRSSGGGVKTGGEPGENAATGPRGYLITIHCMTPYTDGLGLVTGNLVKELQARSQHAAAPPPDAAPANDAGTGQPPADAISNGPEYRFEKIWLPKVAKLIDDPQRAEQLKARAKDSAEHRRAEAPGGMGMQGFGGRRTGMANFAPRPMGLPAGFPGAAAPTGGPADADPLLDPQTNEPILQDWDVIVMVAVVLDPKPAASGDTATPVVTGGAGQNTPVRPGSSMPRR